MGNSVISIRDKKGKCSLQGEGFFFVPERKEENREEEGPTRITCGDRDTFRNQPAGTHLNCSGERTFKE